MRQFNWKRSSASTLNVISVLISQHTVSTEIRLRSGVQLGMGIV